MLTSFEEDSLQNIHLDALWPGWAWRGGAVRPLGAGPFQMGFPGRGGVRPRQLTGLANSARGRGLAGRGGAGAGPGAGPAARTRWPWTSRASCGAAGSR